jgi:hypothetical protein
MRSFDILSKSPESNPGCFLISFDSPPELSMEKEGGHRNEDDNQREKERGFDCQVSSGDDSKENDEAGK